MGRGCLAIRRAGALEGTLTSDLLQEALTLIYLQVVPVPLPLLSFRADNS